MRAHAQENTLEVYGVEARSDFTIKANGKAFRALIDSLYSDKITSTVRELCTNANDGHIRAKNPAPFYVHAPDETIPEFYVRDYGCGMDHDTVTALYTTLFASDKDQGDEEAGMWGLGSKSPFASTSQFFVHCHEGPTDDNPGTVRNYVCAMGPDGVPQLLFHGVEPCDEPTGVRVGFSVVASDFKAFRDAIKTVSFGFSPCFEANCEVSSFDKITPVLQGHGWRAFEKSAYNPGAGGYNAFWFIRQGCVVYPLAAHEKLNLPNESKLRFLIDMPMGSVGVTVSREAVEYTPRTVEAIKARLDLVRSQVEQIVEDTIKDEPTISRFVNRRDAIKPSWVERTYVHQPTQLSSTTYRMPGSGGVFTATLDQRKDRWNFGFSSTITLSDTSRQRFYTMADLSSLLDEGHKVCDDAPLELSPSERRRMARLVRYFAQHKGEAELRIGFGFESWSEAFWAATLPGWDVRPITLDDLKTSVPKRARRVAEPGEELKPLIRGLALARAQGDQQPLDAIPESLEDAAWVPAEDWRRRSAVLWRLSKTLRIKKLFIASQSAQPTIKGAGVPSMLEFANASFARHGTSILQIATVNKHTATYQSDVITIGLAALRHDEALYDRAARGKGLFSETLKAWKPMLTHRLQELEGKAFQSDELYALRAMAFGEDKIDSFKPDDAIKSLCSKLKANTTHPLFLIIDGLERLHGRLDREIEGVIETLLHAQRQFTKYEPVNGVSQYY